MSPGKRPPFAFFVFAGVSFGFVMAAWLLNYFKVGM